MLEAGFSVYSTNCLKQLTKFSVEMTILGGGKGGEQKRGVREGVG